MKQDDMHTSPLKPVITSGYSLCSAEFYNKKPCKTIGFTRLNEVARGGFEPFAISPKHKKNRRFQHGIRQGVIKSVIIFHPISSLVDISSPCYQNSAMIQYSYGKYP